MTHIYNSNHHTLAIILTAFLIAAANVSAKPAAASGNDTTAMPIQDLKRIADSLYYRGIDRAKAESLYRQALRKAEQPLSKDDEKTLAAVCSNYATFLIFERNNPMQAYPLLRRSLDMVDKYRDEGFSLVAPFTNMSHLYANFNDTVKALDYLRRGFECNLNGNTPGRAGYVYSQLLFMAWDFGRLSEIQAERDRFLNTQGLEEGPMYAYNRQLSVSVSDYLSGDYEDASMRLENATQLIDSDYDRDIYTAMTLLMAADAAIEARDLPRAAQLIDRSKGCLNGYVEFNGRDFYNKVLGRYYRASGRPDLAEECLVNSLVMRDSLYNARNMNAISDMEQDLLTSKFDTELREARLHQDLLREKNRRQQTIIAIMAISSAIIITLLLFLIYKRRKLRECRYDLTLKNLDLNENTTMPATADSDSTEELQEKEALAETFASVKDFMTGHKEVFDVGFSIQTMSQICDIPVKSISRAINLHSGKNFSLFVSEYRIREACRIMLEADSENRPTIEYVAEKVGYRSRTHFSRTFKSVTGLTTSEFIKQSKNAVREM